MKTALWIGLFILSMLQFGCVGAEHRLAERYPHVETRIDGIDGATYVSAGFEEPPNP